MHGSRSSIWSPPASCRPARGSRPAPVSGSRPRPWSTATAPWCARARPSRPPSGAGKHVKGSVTNGWTFWRLEDGRRLADVRAVYRTEKPTQVDSKPSFDWSELHAILELLPEGSWTTYGELADAVGTAAQPLGNHMSRCPHCVNVNAHRVLTHDGQVAESFRWTDPDDHRKPIEMLSDEGIRFVNDRADDSKRLASDDLAMLK